VPFQHGVVVFILPNLEQNELASRLGELLCIRERLLGNVGAIRVGREWVVASFVPFCDRCLFSLY
jgi:hypothetical protein